MLNLNIHSGLQDGASVSLGSGVLEFGYDTDSAYELLEGDQPFKITLQVKSVDLAQVRVNVIEGDVKFCDALGQTLEGDVLTAPFFIGVGETYFSVSLLGYVELPSSVLRFFTQAQDESATLVESDDSQRISHASEPIDKAEDLKNTLASTKRKAAFLFLASALSLVCLAFYILLVPQEVSVPKVSVSSPKQLKIVQPSGILPVISQTKPVFSEAGDDAGTLSVEDQHSQGRRWLYQALDENGLSEQIKVDTQNSTFVLQGRLSKVQLGSFEKLLMDFGKLFGEHLQINASIEKPKDIIPFAIREVSPGPDGWVVASTGEKIFVGGEYLGYRLVSIHKNRISLKGPHPIEVEL